MSVSDEGWLHHANPWSGWPRVQLHTIAVFYEISMATNDTIPEPSEK